jgi:hypothetical protein
MKFSYTWEDVERWRDKSHRRIASLAVQNERQALSFINSVGFCLAAKADGLELPNLWDAVTSAQANLPSANETREKPRSYYLSYAWEIQSILPNHNSVYYGKLFRRRPSLVSKEFFPYFYALTERTGTRDEHREEHAQGRLSPPAKTIMDALMKRSPMTAKELRAAIVVSRVKGADDFDKAIEELQRKMFVGRIVGTGTSFGAEWAPIIKSFASEVRKSRKISAEQARYKLLSKYFENQLVSTINTIHDVFGWQRQNIYHSIGQLVHAGKITTGTVVQHGKSNTCYCLIR